MRGGIYVEDGGSGRSGSSGRAGVLMVLHRPDGQVGCSAAEFGEQVGMAAVADPKHGWLWRRPQQTLPAEQVGGEFANVGAAEHV
ncbi:hypothetical protein [Streptomyces cinereoruber]|uniref:hypothetical protein n=1 Tax=Streptomyces cinereoruber TaxID=67260 RepID=UPI00363D15C2